MKTRLQEKAASTNEASKIGLAFIEFNHSYVLYDASIFIDALKMRRNSSSSLDKSNQKMLESIYAYIDVNPDPEGESWGASEVSYSAARPGYGPLMYDIAMSHEHGLISDRYNVSKKAKSVWDHYFDRKDVSHKKLDDIDDPKTKTKRDDGHLYHNKNSSLNYAYFLKRSPNISALIANHKKVVNFAKTKNLDIPISVDELLVNIGHRFFELKYEK